MSITRGNADNYETDAMTVGGQKLVIKITDTGYYYLDVEGPGGRPAISEQLFTSLAEVRKARAAYIQDNIGRINKQKMIEEIAGPLPERKRVAKTKD